MNCKPGDLAVVVGAKTQDDERFLGAVRRVTTSRACDRGYPVWEYEGERLTHPFYGVITGLADDLLRPIRPQPDDATDESLTWKPSPVWERAWERA